VRARRKAEKLAAASNSNFLAPPNSTASAGAGRKMRKAAGWRGLSVDLITHPEENALAPNDTGNGSLESMDSNETEDVRPDDRLDGYTVKRIWTCSKLEPSKLRDIWYAHRFYAVDMRISSIAGEIAILIIWGLWIWMPSSKACGA
jgi:hypothetical protein